MEIKLTTNSLTPPLYYELSKVKENELQYKYYNVRHPGAIFNIHFSDTVSAFNQLFITVNNLQAVGEVCSDEDMKKLQSETLNFLFHLMRYFESGYEIFLCFCLQLKRPAESQSLSQWFRQSNYKNNVESYFSNTEPTLGIYRKFFNYLKHSSNQIMIFQFMKPNNSGKTLGFYLEGVDNKGVIGPVEALHPQHKGCYTAWSYNFHLSSFYYLIYKIALEIEETIKKLCIANNISLDNVPTPLVATSTETLSRNAFTNARRLISSVNFYYEQEIGKKIKSVSISPNNDQLVFSDYEITESNIVPRGSMVEFVSKGDGFSRSWSLIYFKGENK
ncbi:hypothetical protein KJ586_04360 [Patescibacteria group bacterium]|nr:hypothetical protein [Patescibacteria group bacterium]MBU4455714.1 hypothetical protein [Patescibacteria group bacterium]